MHALDILGDPVRRRILELLVSGERTSGAVVDVVNREFGISENRGEHQRPKCAGSRVITTTVSRRSTRAAFGSAEPAMASDLHGSGHWCLRWVLGSDRICFETFRSTG